MIIRVAGDRNRYINALALSDQGGDLAPLTGVFMRTLKRSIKDLQDPRWALGIFEAEILQRAESSYTRWRQSFTHWLDMLGGALLLHRMFVAEQLAVDFRDGLARAETPSHRPRPPVGFHGPGRNTDINGR